MHTYSFAKLCDPDRLKLEIETSSITVALSHITTLSSPPETKIHFKAELSSEDATALDDIVSNHSNEPLPQENLVKLDAPHDAEKSPILRTKTTSPGWHYAPRFITGTTGIAGSLHNSNHGEQDIGDATLRFWDASGDEILQGEDDDATFQVTLDNNCVCTTIDWQAAYDIDIRGASLLTGDKPSVPVWGHAIVAPDLPVEFGGPVAYTEGGIPLHLIAANARVFFDGVTVKRVVYDPVYNTNVFRALVFHPAGTNYTFCLNYEQFKE
jgi:hypothetical protein